MAAAKALFNKCEILNAKTALLRAYIQQNGMSRYPSYYIKPIYQKETQEELYKSGEAQKLAHIPTRPPENSQTCSVFHDPLINLFINYVMKDGRKILARELVEKALEKIKRVQLEKYHKASEKEKPNIELNPKVICHKAVTNCKPLLKLTPIKRGGVTYQVPVPITNKTSQFMAMKWLIEAGNEKERGIPFFEKFAYELIDASNHNGRVVKKKQELHKQCEANRAYAHYRWN